MHFMVHLLSVLITCSTIGSPAGLSSDLLIAANASRACNRTIRSSTFYPLSSPPLEPGSRRDDGDDAPDGVERVSPNAFDDTHDDIYWSGSDDIDEEV